jgi:hypothetical protein
VIELAPYVTFGSAPKVIVWLSTTPVPLRPTVCVDPAVPLALSVMTRVALRPPDACGEKYTEIVHALLPLADDRLPVQVVESVKSPGFVPENAMLLIVSGPVPPFVKATVSGVLVLSRFWFPNASVLGLGEAWGTPRPVPLSEMV